MARLPAFKPKDTYSRETNQTRMQPGKKTTWKWVCSWLDTSNKQLKCFACWLWHFLWCFQMLSVEKTLNQKCYRYLMYTASRCWTFFRQKGSGKLPPLSAYLEVEYWFSWRYKSRTQKLNIKSPPTENTFVPLVNSFSFFKELM